MGKKRGKDRSSREEDDDIELTVPSCRHIKTGTDQSLLKKLPGIPDLTNCQDCKHEENKENTTVQQDSEEEKEPASIWMCLKCGHRGCGRNSENRHAIKHYETPRSSPHCLVISLDNWSVWCYLCDDDVQYSRTGYLAQLVTNIKKQNAADTVKRPGKRVKDEVSVWEAKENSETVKIEKSENEENKSTSNKRKNGTKESAGKTQNCITTEEKAVIPVKGLSNLGNTCFFNAVIQNLSQTQLLRETLNKVTGENLNLDIKPGSMDLEPIVVSLAEPGSLTWAMCHLLNEIQLSKKGVVTPRELFTQVCKKAARFKGFQQQDSQELLHYLLDGMRAEEQKRVSTAIMETLKLANKDTDTDGDEVKRIAKEYEKNGLPKNFVDQVFGGEMTSTIMCQQCKTVSVVTEMFLDLSLPVVDEAYKKKNQRKGAQKSSESSQDGRSSPAPTSRNEDIPIAGTSKYQQKKAKKQAKKQSKQQKRQQKLESRITLDSLTDNTENEQTSASLDPEETETANKEEQEETSASDPNPDATSASEQDKRREQEEEEDMDSSSTSNRFTVLSEEQHSEEKIVHNKLSKEEQEEEDDTQLVNDMEKVTLDDAFLEDSEAVDQNMESEDEVLDPKEYTVVNQDPELAFSTLATRTAPEKQECSVQSCLFQFTEVETLMLNNSLMCFTCTKQQQQNDRGDGPKKNVYTDALKQMLISSPPAVLTLHLKRFQQNGYAICKVNRYIDFPLILDLAPYCAAKCKVDINVSYKEETGVLYSLYGVVEHSGTMRSGHYTAYVKVRPNRYENLSNGLSTEEPSVGSWFHISDTCVQPVSENKVQSCQAYLLFYERVH